MPRLGFLDRVLAIHELGCLLLVCWLLGMPRLSFLDRVLAIHELGCLLLVCWRGQPGGVCLALCLDGYGDRRILSHRFACSYRFLVLTLLP